MVGAFRQFAVIERSGEGELNPSMQSLPPHGTRALVTGGSRGIGLAMAESLAEAGCDVVLGHFRDKEKAAVEAQRLARATGRTVHALDRDVGVPLQARALVDDACELLGGLDILVNNAGICEFTPFLEITDDLWARHLAVNLNAGFWVGQQGAKRMLAAGRGGRIIFTTSVGAFRSNATQTHYCASKAGVALLAQGMALELAPHGITVNCIAPGWIHTDINHAQSTDTALVTGWLSANCPVGRLGRPADLKAVVRLFASKESGYINGATLTVDGGWNAQL